MLELLPDLTRAMTRLCGAVNVHVVIAVEGDVLPGACRVLVGAARKRQNPFPRQGLGGVGI